MRDNVAKVFQEFARILGVPSLFSHQEDALRHIWTLADLKAPWSSLRLCLYYRTGAGKTVTALMLLAEWRLIAPGPVGMVTPLVIAPPITHDAWRETADLFKMSIQLVTIQKARMKTFKFDKTQPVIVDEFHQAGGHTGQGWKRLDRLSEGLKAPLILMSATPNYNDAERVYCIQHVLDPESCRGGFINFLHRHCVTSENPYGSIPKVEGFHHFKDAEEYLVSLPGVLRAEDIHVLEPEDVYVPVTLSAVEHSLGIDRYKERFMASDMERRVYTRVRSRMDGGVLRSEVEETLIDEINRVNAKVFVYCDSKEIAQAARETLLDNGFTVSYIDGGTKPGARATELVDFIHHDTNGNQILLGTSALSTGTDGMDKVCDHVILLDDTPDDSLRKQILGRILPRGADSDASGKKAIRIVPTISYV